MQSVSIPWSVFNRMTDSTTLRGRVGEGGGDRQTVCASWEHLCTCKTVFLYNKVGHVCMYVCVGVEVRAPDQLLVS